MKAASKTKTTIKKDAKSINKYLLQKIRGRPPQLYSAAAHLISSGGKRLRPYMVLKSCQVVGGRYKDAIAAASAIEMIHNFTLVHDDIMDNDDMRHGVPTVHKKYGLPIAILAGDVLFSKAYEIISSNNSTKISASLVSRLARACVEVCEGQVLDIMMAQKKSTPTQQQYIEMITKKTAALFDVSCTMGAICGKKSTQKDVANMSNFGKNLGIAFQITDDLIGVMGDPKVTKKPVGNDLREGKKSLPILLVLKKAKGKDKELVTRVFGNKKATKRELNDAVKVIRSLGIEEMVRGQALEYAKRSERSLGSYSGKAKEELLGLLDFVVKRSL